MSTVLHVHVGDCYIADILDQERDIELTATVNETRNFALHSSSFYGQFNVRFNQTIHVPLTTTASVISLVAFNVKFAGGKFTDGDLIGRASLSVSSIEKELITKSLKLYDAHNEAVGSLTVTVFFNARAIQLGADELEDASVDGKSNADSATLQNTRLNRAPVVATTTSRPSNGSRDSAKTTALSSDKPLNGGRSMIADARKVQLERGRSKSALSHVDRTNKRPTATNTTNSKPRIAAGRSTSPGSRMLARSRTLSADASTRTADSNDLNSRNTNHNSSNSSNHFHHKKQAQSIPSKSPPKFRDTRMSVGFVHNRWPEPTSAEYTYEKQLYSAHIADERRIKLLRDIADTVRRRNLQRQQKAELIRQQKQRSTTSPQQQKQIRRVLAEREEEIRHLQGYLKHLTLHGDVDAQHFDDDNAIDNPDSAYLNSNNRSAVDRSKRTKSPSKTFMRLSERPLPHYALPKEFSGRVRPSARASASNVRLRSTSPNIVPRHHQSNNSSNNNSKNVRNHSTQTTRVVAAAVSARRTSDAATNITSDAEIRAASSVVAKADTMVRRSRRERQQSTSNSDSHSNNIDNAAKADSTNAATGKKKKKSSTIDTKDLAAVGIQTASAGNDTTTNNKHDESHSTKRRVAKKKTKSKSDDVVTAIANLDLLTAVQRLIDAANNNNSNNIISDNNSAGENKRKSQRRKSQIRELSGSSADDSDDNHVGTTDARGSATRRSRVLHAANRKLQELADDDHHSSHHYRHSNSSNNSNINTTNRELKSSSKILYSSNPSISRDHNHLEAQSLQPLQYMTHTDATPLYNLDEEQFRRLSQSQPLPRDAYGFLRAVDGDVTTHARSLLSYTAPQNRHIAVQSYDFARSRLYADLPATAYSAASADNNGSGTAHVYSPAVSITLPSIAAEAASPDQKKHKSISATNNSVTTTTTTNKNNKNSSANVLDDSNDSNSDPYRAVQAAELGREWLAHARSGVDDAARNIGGRLVQSPFAEEDFQVPAFLNSFVYAAPAVSARSNTGVGGASHRDAEKAGQSVQSKSQVLLPQQHVHLDKHANDDLSHVHIGSHTAANAAAIHHKPSSKRVPFSYQHFEVPSHPTSTNKQVTSASEPLNTSDLSSTVSSHIYTVSKAIGLLEARLTQFAAKQEIDDFLQGMEQDDAELQSFIDGIESASMHERSSMDTASARGDTSMRAQSARSSKHSTHNDAVSVESADALRDLSSQVDRTLLEFQHSRVSDIHDNAESTSNRKYSNANEHEDKFSTNAATVSSAVQRQYTPVGDAMRDLDKTTARSSTSGPTSADAGGESRGFYSEQLQAISRTVESPDAVVRSIDSLHLSNNQHQPTSAAAATTSVNSASLSAGLLQRINQLTERTRDSSTAVSRQISQQITAITVTSATATSTRNQHVVASVDSSVNSEPNFHRVTAVSASVASSIDANRRQPQPADTSFNSSSSGDSDNISGSDKGDQLTTVRDVEVLDSSTSDWSAQLDRATAQHRLASIVEGNNSSKSKHQNSLIHNGVLSSSSDSGSTSAGADHTVRVRSANRS